MCGIAAFLSNRRVDRSIVAGMVERIIHRGPNYQDVRSFLDGKVWLGHARLSIIDLSEQGNQPMSYSDGRYWLTYNGEVYNYLELRDELKKYGYTFQTDTDSEVVLAAYDKWGHDCVNHFNGMFSFVILDLKKHDFFAARDRFGVKPFYYWIPKDKEFLAVASEIKEFVDLPEWKPQVNGQRAYDYLKYGLTDHTNETMFAGIYQLLGGEWMAGSLDNPTAINISRWYPHTLKKSKVKLDEASNHFRDLFQDSVKLRLRSDVKVGSCLSGGLDSSSIVCVMNDILASKGAAYANNQRVVSAKAGGTKHDETKYMEEVKNKRNIQGYYVEPTAEDLFESLKRLIWHQDEPFGSTSIFAQWLVFKAAGENNLTVMLDGQGADELLAGYSRFFSPLFGNLFSHLHWIRFAKEAIACHRVHNYPYSFAVRGVLNTYLPDRVLVKLKHKYRRDYNAKWFSVEKLKARKESQKYFGGAKARSVKEMSDQLLFFSNLPMLLRYEDRNSMAHSVESRLPFLDCRLVEYIRSIPDECKISDGITKRVLREGMCGILPDAITDRMDKIGFETQEEVWEKQYSSIFKDMIRDAIKMTDGIITDKAIDYFDYAVQKDKQDFTIWRIINFGYWYDMYINGNHEELKRLV